jgi:phosphatidylglycerol:prolipoprotein diacylglycerol transferase
MYPVLFKMGNISVSSFSVMVLIAFLTAYILGEHDFKRKGINSNLVDLLLIATVVGGLGGAKIMFLYQQVTLSSFIADPVRYLASGFTFFGGLIGAILLTWLVTQMKRVSFLVVTDLMAPLLVIAYGIGRIGCFLVGDDYGNPTNVPWAMTFPHGSPPTTQYVHPTQIYDTICMFILFAILWRIRKKDRPAGWMTAVTFIILGIQRFLMEIIRHTTPSSIPGLTESQLIAIGFAVVGAVMLWVIKNRPDKREQSKPAKRG